MNTTHKTLVGLIVAVVLGTGLTACSSDPVAPAKIRPESNKVAPAPQPADACPLHTACAR
jgi:hypothetical protein